MSVHTLPSLFLFVLTQHFKSFAPTEIAGFSAHLMHFINSKLGCMNLNCTNSNNNNNNNNNNNSNNNNNIEAKTAG